MERVSKTLGMFVGFCGLENWKLYELNHDSV